MRPVVVSGTASYVLKLNILQTTTKTRRTWITSLKQHFICLLASLGVLLSTACTTETTTWSGTISDSAGVTIVMNTHEGMWAAGDEWTFEEELRFGALEAEPEYQFGQIGWIAVGSNNDIYVTDIQAQQVRVFTNDGHYIRTVGGPGNGPGELGRNARYLMVTPGDTLIVPDPTNRRINRYAPDGTALASVPLRPEEGRPVRYYLTRSGVLIAQVRMLLPDTLDHLVVVESSGQFGDTLITSPSGGASRTPGETHQFSPEPMWNVTDSLTVVYGVNRQYRIGMYDRSGTLTRILAREHEPAPVTDRDLRAYWSYLDRAWIAAGVNPSRLPELHARVKFAEVYPAYYAILFGPRGSIWVQRIQTPGGLSDEELERYNFLEEFGSTISDVYDRDARYLGAVKMPDRFQPRTFRGDEIYGVWRDELDVQYVMRLRVVTEQ